MALRRTVAWLVVSTGLLLAAGCGTEPVPPMRIGTVLWSGNELLFLARHRGALNEERFRLVELSNDLEVIRAFRNGAVEAATMSLAEVLYTVQEQADPVILVAIDESVGGDALVAQAGFKRLEDLRGKKIGVQVNSVSYYLLRRALQRGGLQPTDVQVVNLLPEKHRRAFGHREIDAVVTYDPNRSYFMGRGGVELFSSAQIPGELINVLVVRRDYLTKHPERGVALYQAWQSARAAMEASAEARAWSADRIQVAPAEFEAMLGRLHLLDEAENRQRKRAATRPLLSRAIHLQTQMRGFGMLAVDTPLPPLLQLPPRVADAIGQE